MASINDLPPPPGDQEVGWYDDGLVPGRERYWNGRSWTAHTRPVQEPLGSAALPGAAATGIDAIPPPRERDPSWHADALVPNRLRWWDGNEWTTLTRLASAPPPATPKTWAQRWAIALIGLAALAGGLAIGFLAAFDESAPNFRRDARESALSDAQERYGVTQTQTETQTVIQTTPAPNPEP